MKNFTDEEVVQILKNVGVDVDCGACMEVAFTGTTTNTHTCEPKRPPYVPHLVGPTIKE